MKSCFFLPLELSEQLQAGFCGLEGQPLHVLGDLLQLLADFQMLRAVLLAFAALFAEARIAGLVSHEGGHEILLIARSLAKGGNGIIS